jgi:murein DD-endopeptidase MepM/ murein hydrolase activator NlpD
MTTWSVRASRRALASMSLTVAVLLMAGPVGADPQDDVDRASQNVDQARNELEKANDDVEQTEGDLAVGRVRLDALIAQIARLTAQLSDLRAEGTEIAARINEVESRIAGTQGEIVELQQAIRTASEAIRTKQDELDGRAWMAYVYGPGNDVEFLLGSASLADLTTRLQIVDRVAESDRALIDKVSEDRTGLQIDQSDMEALELTQRQTQADLERQQAALQSNLTRAQTVFADLQQAKADADAVVASLTNELVQAEEGRRLAEATLAAELEAKRRAEELVQRSQIIGGVLQLCPVDPPRAYSDDFGSPRWTGGYHPHQGNDIFAPAGTPIRAPFDGVAEDATNEIGGLSVKVFGAEGYVYNAHLSAFGELGPVTTGTVIGFVGATGNAQGTSPHDHFEWHPGGGAATNPFPYLNAVC